MAIKNLVSLFIIKRKEIVHDGEIYNVCRVDGFYPALELRNNDFMIAGGELSGKTLSQLSKQGYDKIDINYEVNIDYITQYYKLKGEYLKIEEGQGSVLTDPNLLSVVKRAYELDIEQTINENTNVPSAINVSEIEKMYKKLTESILLQDDNVKKILSSIYFNNKILNSNLDVPAINNSKTKIIIENGCDFSRGEREILRMCSSLFNMPIVFVDCDSTYPNDEDIAEQLLNEASGNVELAERGIVVFENLISSDFDSDNDPKFLFDNDKIASEGKIIDTRKLTIVAIGSFKELDCYTDSFNCHVYMNQINEKDYKYIAQKSNLSPLNTYEKIFQQLGVEFKYTEEYLETLFDNYDFRTIEDFYMQITNDINRNLYEVMSGKCKGIVLDTSFDDENIKTPYTKLIG